jgi:hypothetical protein
LSEGTPRMSDAQLSAAFWVLVMVSAVVAWDAFQPPPRDE